jgi:flagellar basal-body rod protein FlgB
MTINFSTALGIHEEALLLRGKRTEVLASNLANVNTPGYQARDLDFRRILQTTLYEQAGTMRLQTSSARHLGGVAGFDSVHDMVSYRISTQRSADGNTVDEQQENAAFARNALEFQASFEFLNRKFLGLMKALKGE